MLREEIGQLQCRAEPAELACATRTRKMTVSHAGLMFEGLRCIGGVTDVSLFRAILVFNGRGMFSA